MIYQVLADGLVVIHLMFILFALLGGLLVLKWKKIIWGHVLAVLWAIWVELQGRICPFTPLENWLRRQARNEWYQQGFIDHFRGFLLPDLQGNGDASLSILMEKIGRQTRIIPTQTAERFRLTEREQEIVKYIADGRTSKEIEQSLSISEHTVKEHVRHLLKKTKTSTRTAVLAQVYQEVRCSLFHSCY